MWDLTTALEFFAKGEPTKGDCPNMAQIAKQLNLRLKPVNLTTLTILALQHIMII